MVGSLVYGDSFDDDYDESMGKANENAAMKKSRNDVDYGSVRVNNVTARPRQNPYNQTEFGYQNVNATPDRYQNVNATS